MNVFLDFSSKLASSTFQAFPINLNLDDDLKLIGRVDIRFEDQFVEDLKSGVVKPYQIPPIRLVKDGKILYSLDNRLEEMNEKIST